MNDNIVHASLPFIITRKNAITKIVDFCNQRKGTCYLPDRVKEIQVERDKATIIFKAGRKLLVSEALKPMDFIKYFGDRHAISVPDAV